MSTSDRRRQKFLERQKKSRRDLRHHVRMIAYNEKKKDDSKTSNREEHIKRDIETRTRNAKRLMTHEWVVDVPCDLGGSNWYVIPRPEGQRCLVVAANGKTISRLRNGSVLHRFQSALPNGSTDTRQSRDVFCILDCIFHKPAKTYFVLDMMCWKGHLLYNCASEFRLFWLHTKLREETNAHTVSRNNNFAFRAVPVVDCDIKGLRAAYSADVPFRRDGVLFVRPLIVYFSLLHTHTPPPPSPHRYINKDITYLVQVH
jgi:snurportin-1